MTTREPALLHRGVVGGVDGGLRQGSNVDAGKPDSIFYLGEIRYEMHSYY